MTKLPENQFRKKNKDWGNYKSKRDERLTA